MPDLPSFVNDEPHGAGRGSFEDRGEGADGREGESPLGLYVHVPFCLKKCRYCDFFSIPSSGEALQRTVGALRKEMEMRGRRLAVPGVSLDTVYIGGGTPSLLSSGQIEGILETAATALPWGPPAELTVEVNPSTVDPEWFGCVRAAGINRVSIGVQSLRDDELAFLGRSHTVGQARLAYDQARAAGFTNVGLDLIYGIPNQERGAWRRTLEEVVSMGPDHVSAYELTLSPTTPLGRALGRGEFRLPADDDIATMFLLAGDILGSAGLPRYEVSNYAVPGKESRHNLHYWRCGQYLGVGPGAHSYAGGRRWWNVRDLPRYVARLERGADPVGGSEKVGPQAARRERILLSLRTRDGVPLDDLGQERMDAVAQMVSSGLAEIARGRLLLTEKGLLLADEVALRVV